MALAFALRFLIDILAGNVMISDENFYATAANSILHGAGANFEHPPLVKLIMAGAIAVIKRGSNGFGIKYSGPKDKFSIPYTEVTTSLCSACASSAMACTWPPCQVSSAPRVSGSMKMEAAARMKAMARNPRAAPTPILMAKNPTTVGARALSMRPVL